MSRIAVTGATGFIGSHLLRRLLTDGHQVTALVRRPVKPGQLPEHVKVEVLGEVDAWDWFSAVRALHHHDVVVHLAALAHCSHRSMNASVGAYRRINVGGTQRVAALAAAAGVPHVVFVSSVHAVTTSSHTVLDESSDCRPTTPYGVSKYEAERAVVDTLNERDTSWTIVRPPPVYGPGQPGNLQKIFVAVQQGKVLPIGRISARRSLIYVENLVDALTRCAFDPRARQRTFFVADGPPVSLREFVTAIGKACGRRPHMWPIPPFLLRWTATLLGRRQQFERLAATLMVNDQAIRQELNWSPPHVWPQGIERTLLPGKVMRQAA